MRRKVWLAVVLQCLPIFWGLVFIDKHSSGGLMHSFEHALPLYFLSWGLGYIYLGWGERWLLTLLAGFFILYVAVPVIGEVAQPFLAPPGSRIRAVHPLFGQGVLGILIAAAVLVMAFDAWRLAHKYNAALNQRASGDNPAPLAQKEMNQGQKQ